MAIFGDFCILCFQRAACSRFQTCILNSHWGHTKCGSMADIQSAAAEIRRGKKRQRRKKNKRQDENIWSARLHRATINYQFNPSSRKLPSLRWHCSCIVSNGIKHVVFTKKFRFSLRFPSDLPRYIVKFSNSRKSNDKNVVRFSKLITRLLPLPLQPFYGPYDKLQHPKKRFLCKLWLCAKILRSTQHFFVNQTSNNLNSVSQRLPGGDKWGQCLSHDEQLSIECW